MREHRVQYSEFEAAQKLGITVERLRALVKDHLLNGEGRALAFRPTDLVLLKYLASAPATAALPPPEPPMSS